MTVKQFFKSTAFKSLAVLLSIVIIAGALLAIFSDLLSVSSEERLARSLSKIYGGDAEVKQTVLSADKKPVAVGDATVNQVYLMDDGNYLIQTTGNGGWSNGSITVWVILGCTGSQASNNLKWNGIKRVVYESNDKQSYIGRFSDADYALFAAHNTDLVAGKLFGDGITVVKTGASAPFTFGALTAAVNAAVTYFKTNILGESSEPEIYQYQSYIDLEKTEITPTIADKKVEYKLVMKKVGMSAAAKINVTVTDGEITALFYDGDLTTSDSNGAFLGNIDASLKDGTYFEGKTLEQLQALLNEKGETNKTLLEGASLSTGASNSSTVLIRAAVFALANYEACLYPVLHEDWITADDSEITPTVADSKVEYKLTMKKVGMSAAAKINVTVVGGEITALSYDGDLTTSDSNGAFLGNIDASLKDGTYFEGKTLEQLQALLNEKGETNKTLLEGASLSTGASNSSTVLIRAAIFALANYDVYLAKGGTQA